MQRILYLLFCELNKKIWNSPLQLMVSGMLLFYMAMVLGSAYACGPGNSDPTQSVFRCSYGEMEASAKALILAGIAVASLCLGRAVSLLERAGLDSDEQN